MQDVKGYDHAGIRSIPFGRQKVFPVKIDAENMAGGKPAVHLHGQNPRAADLVDDPFRRGGNLADDFSFPRAVTAGS
jgi:hypothetical protein